MVKHMKFEENLRELRKNAGLSQEELAERLDVSRQSVSKWENGSASPELEKLMQICDLFHCTLDELLKGELKEQPSLDKETYEKQRKLERLLVTVGVGLLIVGASIYCLLEPRFTGTKSMYADVIFLLFVFAGVICFVTMGMKSSFFRRRYPQIPQYIYSEEEKIKVEHGYFRSVIVGVSLILCGIIMQQLLDARNDAISNCIFLLMVAAAVMNFVYVGMWKSSIEDTEKSEVVKSKEEERVSTYCGIIMIIATGVFFGWSFIFHAWEYSWLAFVFGGLVCLIVSMLFKQK